MNKTLRIALVKYINTLPFQWAFSKINTKLPINMHLVNPAECARFLKEDLVDLALIPVGALEDFEQPEIVTDFGISCDGKVKTVCLFSNSPIEKTSTLYLDNHSRTSQKLALIYLLEQYQIKPDIKIVDAHNLPAFSSDFSSVLMIGDKVFSNEKRFRYKYDLGEAWKEMTGLPFVFAVWVTKSIDFVGEKNIKILNDEFFNVINHLEEIIVEKVHAKVIKQELVQYFRQNIEYQLGKDKMMSMKLYMQKAEKYGINEILARSVASR